MQLQPLLLLFSILLLSLCETDAKKHPRRHPRPHPKPKSHKHPNMKKITSTLFRDHAGTATWFTQDSEGSCGHWSKDGDMVVALPES